MQPALRLSGPLLAAVMALATAAIGHAADSPVPAPVRLATVEATIVPEAAAVQIDGEISEPVWQTATVVSGFQQREPREGDAASFETEARLLMDGQALYVGVRASDPKPADIVGHLTRRDEWSPSDWLRVLIDSFNDRRTAFEFAVNAAGVKADAYWFNDGQQDQGWDAVWDVATRVDEQGWQAEFRIPYSQLRFPKVSDGRLGFAVFRRIARLNETSSWPLVAQSRSGYVSQFGQLTNLAPSSSPKRLELVPYAVSQLTTSPSTDNPLVKTNDPDASMGLDLKYAVTPGLTLTATVNPDFGQVEADPAVVNLSAFETFYPERRPFFVEGSGNFRFDLDCNDGACTGLFYSRRIGRQPQGSAEVDEGEYSSAPLQTTILGATKLTGRLGAFSIGALNALTQEEQAVATLPGGGTNRQSVEPFTSYSVVRARREFANNSNVGFMVTATNRAVSDNLEPVLADQAYTGGVDVDWRLTPRYQFTGYWAGSTVRGTPASIQLLQENSRHYFQRPDADYLDYDPTRESINGHAGEIALSKIGGERVRFRSGLAYKSPGFDINDIGFLRRADTRSMSNWLQWRFLTPTTWYRAVRLNFNQWGSWNFGGDRLNIGTNVNGHLQFLNNWRVGGGVTYNMERLDDRLTRGGPGGLRPATVGSWHYVEGDDRLLVTPAWMAFFGTNHHGMKDVELNPSIIFRPTSALSIEPGFSWSHNTSDAQWLENVEDNGTHYVFGELDQKTVALTLRVNYTIRPTLSLQVYAQPFVSAGAYSDYKEQVDGRADDYADRFQPYAYQGEPDFNYSSLRMTNVLRWEYRPGSTLFVVWQQGREDTLGRGDFQFGRDLRHVFSTPAQNVFLVKFAYWVNM